MTIQTGALRHRHLVHQEFTTAAIEDILDRGEIRDWEQLIAARRALIRGLEGLRAPRPNLR
jgi:hypothetical protein